MTYPIEGFGIAGFRSFGERVQRVGPCKKINFLIGQNNSGKSNILLFLANWYGNALQSIRSNNIPKLQELDYHLGSKTKALTVELAINLEGEIYHEMLERLKSNSAIQSIHLQLIKLILKSDFFPIQTG